MQNRPTMEQAEEALVKRLGQSPSFWNKKSHLVIAAMLDIAPEAAVQIRDRLYGKSSERNALEAAKFILSRLLELNLLHLVDTEIEELNRIIEEEALKHE